MSGWKTIDSAPTELTLMLLTDGRDVHVGIRDFCPEDEKDGTENDDPEWWWMIGPDQMVKMENDPTHWMSLPKPPTQLKGPGSTTVRLEDAEKISAAVRCGIPWRVAMMSIDRLRPFRGGIIILEGTTYEDADRGQSRPQSVS